MIVENILYLSLKLYLFLQTISEMNNNSQNFKPRDHTANYTWFSRIIETY